MLGMSYERLTYLIAAILLVVIALWELSIPARLLTILVPVGFATLFLILDRRAARRG
jgi:hypothetical protein